jgi:pimeloyl-ACP methyl ester carboxylesterase
MPAVFVHGNPETPAIWGPLVDKLQRSDVELVHLPGFGTPAPAGFGATKDDYASWLVGELERIFAESGPIDLVGHDWGGGFVLRAAELRPDLLRSWASDVLGLLHEKLKWHEYALIWQTAGDGEAYFDTWFTTPMDDRVSAYMGIGMTEDVAREINKAHNEETGRCILALYRSAVPEQMGEWRSQIDGLRERPGLALHADQDPYTGGHNDIGAEVADKVGARRVTLVGQGHWWMLSDPAGGAVALEDFWSTLG